MLKYIALLFNTVALLIYQFFFAEGITVTQQIPSSAKADTEFMIELTINKGSIGGFAKLQQDLPEGFTAVQEENNGASFTFSNQAVKFIWMSLPAEKEFKVKYKIKVAAGIKGEKVISGKFSYVTDNIKQSVDVVPSTITIIDDNAAPESAVSATTTSPDTAQKAASTSLTELLLAKETPVTTATQTSETTTVVPATTVVATETVATTNNNQEALSITCVRTIPSNIGDSFIIEITVNKGNATGFAKLIETLPPGFTATAGSLENASFSFADQKAKFVWVTMPSKTEFKISYKVTVAPGTSGTQSIDGVFSYIENDETKKYIIPTSAIVINGATPIETPVTPVIETPAPVVITKKEKPVSTTKKEDNAKSLPGANNVTAPQGSVNYTIQIAALRKQVNANKLAARYKINTPINTEMAHGFTKYMTGSHREYKNARDAREEIKKKGVAGPFIAAYNGGKRITIQEALMITSQKWLP